jgi:hypothetical protein
MINQAKAAGLKTNTAMINHLVLGRARKDSNRVYVAPSVFARVHRSLRGFWWILEIIPKRTKWREWTRRPSIFGFYLPLGEPRFVPEGALIHASVIERMALTPEYNPLNLPKTYRRVR